MAQDPLQLDAIQIEPSSGDTITISRGSGGALEFVDAIVTGGIALSRLAGLLGNTNVLVVGDGAEYSSIQDAIDAVPATSSGSNPHAILVTPGVYTESLTVEKDGISIIGIGNPTISADVETDDALTLQDSVSTSPKYFSISGCKISCDQDNASCVRIIGGAGSSIGEDQIYLKDLQLQASGIGSRPLRAETAGNIIAEGGSWSAVETTYVEAIQCASLFLKGIKNLSAVSVTYTTAAAESSTSVGKYTIQDIAKAGDILVNMSGGGSALISGCPEMGDVTCGGDQSLKISSSGIGNLTINNTSTVSVLGSEVGTLSGDGSVSISGIRGEIAFVAEAIADVVFDVAQVDTDYTICAEVAPDLAIAGVHSKTVNGFRIEFDQARTGNLRWHLLRS